jgi:hypothetical protein
MWGVRNAQHKCVCECARILIARTRSCACTTRRKRSMSACTIRLSVNMSSRPHVQTSKHPHVPISTCPYVHTRTEVRGVWGCWHMAMVGVRNALLVRVCLYRVQGRAPAQPHAGAKRSISACTIRRPVNMSTCSYVYMSTGPHVGM